MKLWRKIQIIGVAIFLFGFILGFAIIIRGSGLDAARSIASPITYIGLFIIGISVMLKFKTRDLPLHDERTKKISGMGFTYSWLATFLFICLLVGLDALNLLKMTMSQILSMIFIFMFSSSIMIQWYFDKKGDVK